MSCTVTETLNGEWELTLVHDIDERGKWTRLSEGCILRAPVPAAMTPSVDLVTQQYQTSTYDVQIYKITTKSGPLHLRSGSGTNYKILGKYKKGREVIVLNKTTSSWYEVTAPDGKHGYMASQYLTFQRTETQTVQTNVGFRNQVIEARQLRDQPFRIYRVVPELDKVTVYARHIFYDLLDNMLKSLKPSPSAVGASVVQSLSGACLSSHDFSLYSDLTSTAEDVEWENINPVEAMLGENGLVSKYGAELARDWYDVFLVRRVGNNTDVSIREKKNLTGISYDVDETDVVTRIMPTGEDADGNVLYLPELYIDSPNINAYTHPKWIHLSVSEAKEVTDGDEPKSKTQCYAEMRKAAQAEFDAGCDLPTVTLKVDFITATNRLLSPTFDALSSYDIKIRVQDVFYYIEQTVSIGTKQVMMDFYKDGSGIAFGKVAENAGKVEFGWPLLLSEPLGVDQGGTGAETASAACTKLGAVKKTGDTMTGNLTISGYLYPSLYLLPTYNSTTNRTVFEGSYIGASSFSSWEDGTGNNRRMLEVRNAAYQASLDFAVLLRTCTGGTWASYRLFHAGMATPIPLANGGTGASSAKAALSNLGIFYSASLPSSGTDGQICLVPV